jgi:formylglycine-generating enzyme required for sulfatase activity
MIEIAINIYNAFTQNDVYNKHIGSLIFGDKRKQYLQEFTNKQPNNDIHLEKLSDTILYAVNLDGIHTKSKQYINNLREIRQQLEIIQAQLNQPILSSALVSAPQQISSRQAHNFLKDISPLKHITIPIAEDWMPILFNDNGINYIGWQSADHLSELGCQSYSQWQPNNNFISKTNPIELRKFLDHGELFDFDFVTVNTKGNIIKRQRQQAYRKLEILANDITLEMIYVPGALFTMGSPEFEIGRNHDETQHKVQVHSFYMSKYPITQEQWEIIMNHNPSCFKGRNLPVEKISWYDAVKFCERLSERTGKLYRLPTEAEWEYACRAGTTSPFHYGDTITPELANYDTNSKGTISVGSYYPNAFGLYDMHGNVWEWTASEYEESNEYKVLRGGSWGGEYNNLRSAFRYKGTAFVPVKMGGFRVVMIN